MNAHIEHQIIAYNGQPAFVVVPYKDYLRLAPKPEIVCIPHEVVGKHTIEGKSLVRAWREYKGFTQEELAESMGISQPAYAQIEKPSARLRQKTRSKVADALGISVDQLTLN